jgi:hypothetical protein
MGWGCSTHWERNACRILVVKSEGKIPLAKPRRRCENNIKMDLRERERENEVVWTRLIWLRTGTSRGLF